MKLRTVLSVLVISLLASFHLAEGQSAKKIDRIGMLTGFRPIPIPPTVEAFRNGLRELGYVEGKNVIIEYRWAEGKDDRYAPLASELVNLGVDVLVVSGTQAAIAAKQATSTIPIIVGGAGDLVGEGLVANLARPGGNLTGFTNIDPDLSTKRLQILKESLPNVTRVAVLYHGAPGGDQEELRETQRAAKKIAVNIQPLHVLESGQIPAVFETIKKDHAQALIIFQSSFTSANRKEIVDLAAKIRIPTMCGTPEWSDAGGLVSYGHNRSDQYRRAAGYVDKVLKGTKPADLPVQQPMKFEFVVNLKTARKIGVTIPPQVLARADRVIK